MAFMVSESLVPVCSKFLQFLYPDAIYKTFKRKDLLLHFESPKSNFSNIHFNVADVPCKVPKHLKLTFYGKGAMNQLYYYSRK